MKKKFLTFALALCFIIPCLFMLTSCGGKCNISMSDDTDPYIGIAEHGTEGYYSNVKKGTEMKYDIMIPDYFDRTTLKVYANGNEIQWQENDDAFTETTYENRKITNRLNPVGTFTIKVETDIEFKIVVEEQIIDFHISLSTNINNDTEKQNILKDFVIDAEGHDYDGKSFFDLTTENIQIVYSQLIDGLKIKTSATKHYNKPEVTNDEFRFWEGTEDDDYDYIIFCTDGDEIDRVTIFHINTESISESV